MIESQLAERNRFQPRPWRMGIITGLVLGLCVAHRASAQGGGAAPQPGTNVSQTLDAMKGDLRRLVSANEVYRAEKGQYAASVDALRGYHPSAGVTVTILQASSTGWAGQATAASVPGKSCVIGVGKVATPPTTLADKRSGAEAVAVCDSP
jgi:hypothetical protein